MYKPFKELTEEEQQPYFDKAAEMLDSLMWCNRTWSAWGYGTMSANDFYNAAEDANLVEERAIMLYEFTQLMSRKIKIDSIISE